LLALKGVQEDLNGNLKNRRRGDHIPLGCCEACYYALGKRCVCSCGGSNHGKGVDPEGGKLPFEMVSVEAQKYWKLIDPSLAQCGFCGTILEGEPIRQYPHKAGWPVKGFDKLQWLFVKCPKCGYDWNLSKLGVAR